MNILEWIKKTNTQKYKRTISSIKLAIQNISLKSNKILEIIHPFLANPSAELLSSIDIKQVKTLLKEQLALEEVEKSHVGKSINLITQIIKKESRAKVRKIENMELKDLSELRSNLDNLKPLLYQKMWYFDLKTPEDMLKQENFVALKRAIAEEVQLLGIETNLMDKIIAETELEDQAEDIQYSRGCRKLILPNGKELVFKPARIQPPYQVIKQGRPTGEVISASAQVLNEVAASVVDEELGFNLVPKTRTKNFQGDFGSVREHIDNAITGKEWLDKHQRITDIKKVLILKRALDYLLNNQDASNLENWLITTDTTQVVVIDNALSFMPGDDSALLKAIQYSPELEKTLKSLNDTRLRRRLLAIGILEEFVEDFFMRKQKLLTHLKKLKKQQLQTSNI
ncbi:hypothetical protein KY333_01385 [Candidatus Woesearchaeota archaeon]|nr:hypothetical protein [Candidatus Woesearchaeota archaeon]